MSSAAADSGKDGGLPSRIWLHPVQLVPPTLLKSVVSSRCDGDLVEPQSVQPSALKCFDGSDSTVTRQQALENLAIRAASGLELSTLPWDGVEGTQSRSSLLMPATCDITLASSDLVYNVSSRASAATSADIELK
ncbi:unnamed protein product, partial [Polarella glacialis]